MKTKHIHEIMEVSLEGEAQEAIEKLAQSIAEKKAAGWIDLRFELDHDYDYGAECVLKGWRPETEKETAHRLKVEAATAKRNAEARAKEQAKELKELARLKAKYGA